MPSKGNDLERLNRDIPRGQFLYTENGARRAVPFRVDVVKRPSLGRRSECRCRSLATSRHRAWVFKLLPISSPDPAYSQKPGRGCCS